MEVDALIGIFKDSKKKSIDIYCDGKLATQFKKCATEVTNHGYGTISVKDVVAGVEIYIDSNHVSNVWVRTDDDNGSKRVKQAKGDVSFLSGI